LSRIDQIDLGCASHSPIVYDDDLTRAERPDCVSDRPGIRIPEQHAGDPDSRDGAPPFSRKRLLSDAGHDLERRMVRHGGAHQRIARELVERRWRQPLEIRVVGDVVAEREPVGLLQPHLFRARERAVELHDRAHRAGFGRRGTGAEVGHDRALGERIEIESGKPDAGGLT